MYICIYKYVIYYIEVYFFNYLYVNIYISIFDIYVCITISIFDNHFLNEKKTQRNPIPNQNQEKAVYCFHF